MPLDSEPPSRLPIVSKPMHGVPDQHQRPPVESEHLLGGGFQKHVMILPWIGSSHKQQEASCGKMQPMPESLHGLIVAHRAKIL